MYEEDAERKEVHAAEASELALEGFTLVFEAFGVTCGDAGSGTDRQKVPRTRPGGGNIHHPARQSRRRRSPVAGTRLPVATNSGETSDQSLHHL